MEIPDEILSAVKVNLRLTTDAFDEAEIMPLINGALCDLQRVGINPSLLELEEDKVDGLTLRAIVLYCKAHFGYDNAEAERFENSYNQVVRDMLNSSKYNMAASRKNLVDAVVSEIPVQAYTGYTVRPVPEVTYDGVALVNGEDFTLSYMHNVQCGIGYAYIYGTGNYDGLVIQEFEIR